MSKLKKSKNNFKVNYPFKPVKLIIWIFRFGTS